SLDLPLESLSLHPFLQSLHKEQWQEVRLGEVAEIFDYQRIPLSTMQRMNRKGAYPYYGASGVIDYIDDFIFDGEFVLISEDGENLRTRKTPIAFKVSGKFWVNNHAHIVKGKKDYFNDLIVYLFENLDLNPYITGAVQPKLNQSTLLNIPLKIPILETTQQKIAEILSSFDDKIDLLHRQNKTLESLALTLFRHYFIDNPNRNEWELGKLGDLLLETLAGDWGKEQQDDENGEMVYCIRGTDIADLQNGLPNKTPIRYVKHKKLMQLQPNNGDIIFEISGGTEMQSTGRCIYINNDIEKLFDAPILFSNFCRLLRVKKAEYGYFLYLYLKFLYNNDEFFALENGTSGIKNLDYKVLLYQHEYTIPNEQQIIRFHKEIEIYYYKINQNKKQIQNLQAMRDMLLKAIFA
ncbi:MAG: restriction endonuclease subunit S, partial [Helicobacter sp.]